MIRCKLSTLMGERRYKISDVARGSGVHRNVVTKYYRDEIVMFSKDVVDKLCQFLGCDIGELFEFVPSKKPSERPSSQAKKGVKPQAEELILKRKAAAKRMQARAEKIDSMDTTASKLVREGWREREGS